MSSRVKILLFSAVFIWLFYRLCCHYYPQLLFAGPAYVHAWAQGDRYALAINFFDHGMDFFHPKTSNLFSTDGITGVEFPIQAYMAAILGHIFGREHISICYKLITLLISFAGLYALFLTVYKRTKDFVFSLATPTFFFCAPVFIYYTCSYLPDTAGASFAFIAFYFVLNYFDSGSKKSYYTALLLLTIGSLIKTTIAIYLLGFIGYVFLTRIAGKDKRTLKSNLSFCLASVLFIIPIVGYYFYNVHLNETYDAHIFTTKAVPFKDVKAFNDYVEDGFKAHWMYDYFSLPQYLAILAIVAPGILLLWKGQGGRKHLSLLGIYLLGSASLFYLLGGQLTAHDYYIIAIIYPLIAYALIVSIIYIRQSSTGIAIPSLRLSFIAAMSLSFAFGYHQYYKRFNEDSGMYRWALNGKLIFDQLHIGKDETVLLVNEFPSNLALTYFDRRGYNFYYDTWDLSVYPVIEKMKKVNTKLAVMKIEVYKGMLWHDSSAFQSFDHLITKDELVVYRLKD